MSPKMTCSTLARLLFATVALAGCKAEAPDSALREAPAPASAPAAPGAGQPLVAGIDHVGITVPDMQQAVDFFTKALGCETGYRLGPFAAPFPMKQKLNVDDDATIPVLMTLRCGHGSNIELFQYQANGQRTEPPRNSDVGGHHLAFYVHDMNAVLARMRANGGKVLGEPTPMTSGPSAGETWVYVLAPWGMQLELVSYNGGKAYEKELPADKKPLWSPKAPAN